MQTTFVKSSSKLSECPQTDLPEIAFVGRSNVGKSSLINMLVGRKALTKVSNTPGKTRLINHFIVDDSRMLVDLPGYGYARASNEQKQKRVYTMYDYLTDRSQLKYTFLLIDSKLTPQKIDISFIEELYEENIPFAVIFTKTDKVKQSAFHQVFAERQKIFTEISDKPPMVFSSSSTKGAGKDEILDFVYEILENS